MSMIAVGERGSLPTLPDMYMRKMAVGPARARHGSTSRDRSATTSARSPTRSAARSNDITTIVLDRPRHHDLIEEIRAAGARIKLIQDGDVTASISAAIRGTNDHLAIGIGGTRQAVLTAGRAPLPRRRAAGAALADVARARSRSAHEPGSRTSSGLHDRGPRAAAR